MFKSWRSDKNKIKTTFKLQFQLTQVPQLKKSNLMISLVPAYVGKPTVRLEKVPVVEGACSWENPIYETVKLTKEPKTGKIKPKIYYFVVSSGSSKAGFLGEGGVDFADYAEAVKPVLVSMPLQISNSGPILHVTIQKTEGSVDLRATEENEEQAADYRDWNFKNRFGDGNIYGEGDLNLTEDENYNSENTAIGHEDQRSNTNWSVGSASDETNSPQENSQIERLKTEISMLERQAEVSELELESLRKQIVKETKRGKDLSSEITRFKEEREELETECKQLKSSQKCINDLENSNRWESKYDNLRVQFEEITRELKHEKDLNSTLQMQLQKMESSNSELLFAMNDLDKMLDEKATEISNQNELKMHMEQLAADYEVLKRENDEISSEMEEKRLVRIKIENEFRVQIESLEREIEIRTEEVSESVDKISELQNQVKCLDNEMEKQIQDFEDDLKAVTEAKVEQEQRAIRAEEALRKTRWNNGIAVERLQEEYLRVLKDEKERAVKSLTLEMENLRIQYNELKQRASEIDSEKENMRKQVTNLEKDLQKKQEAIINLEKNLKCSRKQANLTEKSTLPENRMGQKESMLKDNANSADKVKTNNDEHEERRNPGENTNDSAQNNKPNVNSLIGTQPEQATNGTTSELASLRQKNKQMEGDLKEMEERYSEISLKFAEVEGERQQLVMALRNLKMGKKN